MPQPSNIDFEYAILSNLQGKLLLLHSQEERIDIVAQVLEKLLKEEPYSAYFSTPQQKSEYITEFLSYGIIEDLLCDPEVEDIVINALKPIYIHHAQKGFVVTPKKFNSHPELNLFIQKLLIFSGRTSYKKIANLELANLAGRVNIIDSPLGPQLTITKAKVDPLSIIDLIKRGSMTFEVAGQLWLYLEGMSVRPANVIIAGGPGTGKTTLLNALLSFIPSKDRLVVIEDTLELNTFMEDSCSRLETDDDMDLCALVKNSLRMRPERVIVGEVRGAEARDMITAVNVGKYCMGTIHALTAREAVMRLHHEPMNVPDSLINLIDLFVVLKRHHIDGKVYRVVDELSETSGMESAKILLSQIYKYSPEQKTVLPVSPSTVYRDRLAQEAGIEPRAIINEAWMRAIVLKTLSDKGITTIKEITTFCRHYNQDPKEAMSKIGLDRGRILKDLKSR